MKNPFPQYGDIKEILHHGCYSFQSVVNINNDHFRYSPYPDEYYLTIKYEKYECEYACFNLKEEQYKEIATNLFGNADFEFNKQGWPVKLVWKDFEFRLTKFEEIIYKE